MALKMAQVSKITFFGLYYPRFMRKTDPNCVEGKKRFYVGMSKKYVKQKMIFSILKEETPTRRLIY